MSSFTEVLKLLPATSPWLLVLGLPVFAILLWEKIFGLATSFIDRRSDEKLLEQADKAASLLEKLPVGHKTSSDLLTYISHGPITELLERQTNRVAKKKNASKRRSHMWYMIYSFGILGIVFFPYLPAYYNQMFSDSTSGLAGLPMSLQAILATLLFFLYYSVVSMILYFIVAGMNFLAELAANGLKKLHKRHVKRRQEQKGKGGVYEI